MKDSLANTAPIETITLTDGKEYTLSPLDLNMLCEVERRFPDVEPITKILDGKMSTIRLVLWLRLRDKYPEVTEESIGKLVSWQILTDIMKRAVRI